jgi:hypothetical protein
MMPAEFWASHMADLAVWIDEREKGHATLAWRIALLGNVDPKKFPKTPEHMWGGSAAKTPQSMFSLLKTISRDKRGREKQRSGKDA